MSNWSVHVSMMGQISFQNSASIPKLWQMLRWGDKISGISRILVTSPNSLQRAYTCLQVVYVFALCLHFLYIPMRSSKPASKCWGLTRRPSRPLGTEKLAWATWEIQWCSMLSPMRDPQVTGSWLAPHALVEADHQHTARLYGTFTVEKEKTYGLNCSMIFLLLIGHKGASTIIYTLPCPSRHLSTTVTVAWTHRLIGNCRSTGNIATTRGEATISWRGSSSRTGTWPCESQETPVPIEAIDRFQSGTEGTCRERPPHRQQDDLPVLFGPPYLGAHAERPPTRRLAVYIKNWKFGAKSGSQFHSQVKNELPTGTH